MKSIKLKDAMRMGQIRIVHTDYPEVIPARNMRRIAKKNGAVYVENCIQPDPVQEDDG